MRALGPFVLCVALPVLAAVGLHRLIDWLI
jgi:hypothetical protein